ncbi:hypothetical protein GOP47_0017668 [Adiantum capillus-veneris]|uniref:Cation/H+ exchanger domain-containing protein n=1 Tax=Adiantum capillus-veneris TaxID=13818 RepID=A0A9D4UG31_ADICA|nr:hypothetical protein GOP47_0017668 [Adiantum capillus-veneris]
MAPACFTPMAATSNGLFQGDNPFKFAVPLLIVQMCLVLGLSRALSVLFKPLGQPRVIAEIIGGILLGPSVLGRSATYLNTVFPKQSITVLDTVADIGLIFFLFLVGLELDLHAIQKTGKQTLSIAGAGISLPFAAGVGVSLILHKTISTEARFLPFVVFMGVAMSITAFPVLARILAERKLLVTDVGQMAMSAAAVNDLVAWILLALAIALSGSDKSPLVAVWVFLSGIAFLLVMFLAVKPTLKYIASQAEEGKPINELHIALILAGVLTAGFATDFIGIHAIFGAFVFGLIVPKEGPLAKMLVEKLEDFVTTLMLPLYFASSGLKTNIQSIHSIQSVGLLLLVIATACVGKILGTFMMASFFETGRRKALALGFLMNTKGLVELIVLNIGKDRQVLNEETFAIMVLMAIFTTVITTPSVMLLYKPARNPVPYRRRKLYQADIQAESELRVLACVYGMPNVHAIINLVEASRGTRKRPLCLYILHLLELTERPSSLMKFQMIGSHNDQNAHSGDHDSVVLAFEAFGQLSKVNVKAMTALSSFDTMHEDVCTSAAEKRAAIIILPFDKHAHHGRLMNVNQKVLQHAPCSVGILVDRGVGVVSLSSSHVQHDVVVLFFGGPDCRESLAFGLRMVEHPGVKVKVLRFLYNPTKDHSEVTLSTDEEIRGSEEREIQATAMASKYENREEDRLDEECLALVKEASMRKQETARQAGLISYEEREVQNTMFAIAEIAAIREFNLVIVGRGRRPSPLVARLASERSDEFPELGPVGQLLLLHCHDNHASILVIQQHDPALEQKEHLTLKSKSDFTSLPVVASGLPLPPSSLSITTPSASSSSSV